MNNIEAHNFSIPYLCNVKNFTTSGGRGVGGIRKPETKRNMEGNYMSFDCKWLVCGDKTVKILSIASLESVISHEITEQYVSLYQPGSMKRACRLMLV